MQEQLDEVTRQRSMAIQEAEMLRRKLAQSETYTDHHTMKLSAEMQQRELQVSVIPLLPPTSISPSPCN